MILSASFMQKITSVCRFVLKSCVLHLSSHSRSNTSFSGGERDQWNQAIRDEAMDKQRLGSVFLLSPYLRSNTSFSEGERGQWTEMFVLPVSKNASQIELGDFLGKYSYRSLIFLYIFKTRGWLPKSQLYLLKT